MQGKHSTWMKESLKPEEKLWWKAQSLAEGWLQWPVRRVGGRQAGVLGGLWAWQQTGIQRPIACSGRIRGLFWPWERQQQEKGAKTRSKTHSKLKPGQAALQEALPEGCERLATGGNSRRAPGETTTVQEQKQQVAEDPVALFATTSSLNDC